MEYFFFFSSDLAGAFKRCIHANPAFKGLMGTVAGFDEKLQMFCVSAFLELQGEKG